MKLPYCFPQWLHIYAPTNRIQGFPFFTSSSTFVIYRLFDDSYSDQYESILILICITLKMSNIEHLLICLLAICVQRNVSFGEISTQFFCPFFNQVAYFLVLSCMSFLYMLDINPLLIISVANIFLFLFITEFYRKNISECHSIDDGH